MLQIYFLSVLLNILGGVTLISGSMGGKVQEVKSLLQRTSVRLGVGSAALAAGVVKLFVRAPFDTVLVAGDLLPALTGIGVGLALLADTFVSRRTESAEAEKVRKAAAFYRVPVAIAGIAVGVLHFLFSSLVIL
jgi:hypothetical protein